MAPATILALLVLGPALPIRAGSDPVDCTFSNPRYAGNCVEQTVPADRQTPVQACRVILDCLNDTRCVKTASTFWATRQEAYLVGRPQGLALAAADAQGTAQPG
jgi:hypothetical protein